MNDERLLQIYSAIWQNINREDAIISNRIGWAISITSGKLAAIAFITPAAFRTQGGLEGPVVIAAAVLVLSIMGIYFCYRTHLGVEAAHNQIDYLKGQYEIYRKAFEDQLCLPKPFGHATQTKPGRKSSRVYPVALLVLWTMILAASGVGLLISVIRYVQ